MAKQKLTTEDCLLIKHLIHNLFWTDREIAKFISVCGEKNIGKIRRNTRWQDVETPNYDYGMELYFRFKNRNQL